MKHTPFDIDPGDETSAMTVIVTGRIRKQLRQYAVRHGVRFQNLLEPLSKYFWRSMTLNQSPPAGASMSVDAIVIRRARGGCII